MNANFYRAFEDVHRGSRALIKKRQEVYLPFINPLKALYLQCSVLDLGCGRGEWLELIQSQGFLARGVDLDEGMLQACQALDLPAEYGDALATLGALGDESQVVVSAFHLIEHIPFDSLQQLVHEALRVLKPAGLLIMETPNPENLLVGTNSFYLDPTHEKPIPHLLLSFLTDYTGFARSKLVLLQESAALHDVPQLTLMEVLSGVSPDYAIIAQKGAGVEQLAVFDPIFDRNYGLSLETLAERYEQHMERRFRATLEDRSLQKIEHLQEIQHQGANVSAELQRQSVELSAELQRQSVELAAELQRQSVELAAELHRQSVERAAELQRHSVEQAVELQRQSVELSAELQRRSDEQAVELQRQSVDFEAELQRKFVELEGELQRQSVGLSAELQHRSAEQAVELQRQSVELEAELPCQFVELEAELHQTRQQRDEALAKAHEIWLQSCAYNSRVQALMSSTSWRLTAPLRWCVRSVRWLISSFTRLLKNGVRRIIVAGLRHTLAHPALRRRLSTSLKRYPRLYESLKRFAYNRGLLVELRTAVNYVSGARGLKRSMTTKLNRLTQPILSDVLLSYSPRVVQLGRHLEHLLDPEHKTQAPQQANQRPRLAYVSPMPPAKTGIADYSAELLPVLAEYYQIDVIVEQESTPSSSSDYQLHDPQWLRNNVDSYSAVLYHFGNSPFHCYMAELIDEVPGIIVLHDFYLSGLIWSMENRQSFGGIKMYELYYSHGYSAMVDALEDEQKIAVRYPFNRSILERAQGVIVHSAVSLRLADQWYGEQACADWVQIPLLRELADQSDKARSRALSREALKLTEDAFVVCSFGLLGETKLNDRLIEAWQASDLASDTNCHLVFVGELGADDYAQRLRKQLAALGTDSRISITGWVDSATFEHFLGAADVAVQLRSLSRGETSAAVLDCMNHFLPTIVNANGSMADLPEKGVLRLPDAFTNTQLVEALQLLRHDAHARTALGQHARDVVEQQHTPEHCAGLYHAAIERYSQRNRQVAEDLQNKLAELPIPVRETNQVLALAEQLLQGHAYPLRPRQLLLDITGTHAVDRLSGIERVAKALTLALLNQPPVGVRVEPVYLSDLGGHWHYRYASEFTTKLLGLPDVLVDRGIDYGPGDQLIALDLSGNALVQASLSGLYKRLQAGGVNCRMLVYDLLPVTRPEFFPPQADQHFVEWLNHVARFDGAVCISNTVAGELRKWMQQTWPALAPDFTFDYSHLGADLSSSAPSKGLPTDANEFMATLALRPSVLMVGTLEPRKGHLQAIDAFTQLWESGVDVNLVIIGRVGWQELPTDQQRSIPQLLARLANHPEKGRRLFWVDGPSDEFLELIYSSVNGLLAASEDEGFGLPLIEAAQKRLPILARDIPVFREVAKDHACYFTADNPQQLASAVASWMKDGFEPSSAAMGWLTWQQSADNLKHLLFDPQKTGA